MSTAIDKAEHDLRNLEEQRESIASRAALLDRQRRSIAFAALTAGDKKAKARLSEIATEDAALTANIASVEAALTVARGNLETARHGVAIAADRERRAQVETLRAKFNEELVDADLASGRELARSALVAIGGWGR